MEQPLSLTPRRRWAVTIGVMTGMFLAALEGTVVGTAMPTVIAALGGLSHYSWVFSAYLLTSTVSVPLWGKLSDLYGRSLLYQIGVGVFLLGSALSGLATSMPQLIAFRALQGLGAGALVPIAMTIIADIFTLQQRTKMQGLFSGVWGISSVVGPLVGGFITDQWNWRWVFFINIPFGIASALIIGFTLPERERPEKPSIDYLGAVTLTASMTLLMLALVETETPMPVWARPLLFAISGMLLIWFFFVERRAPEPMIPFDLFHSRVVTVGTIVGFLAGIGMFGAISFVPLFAQGVRGSTATEAGSLLTPLMLSWVMSSIIGGRLLLRMGYKPMVILGTILMTAGFFLFATFDQTTPRWHLLLDLTIIGTGLGLVMLTLLIALQHSVPRAQLGIATSLNLFSRSIGGAIGVAIMGTILTVGMRGVHFDPRLILHGGSFAPSPDVQEALANALQKIFIFGGIFSVGSIIASFFLPGGVAGDLAPTERDSHRSEDLMMAELGTMPEHEES